MLANTVADVMNHKPHEPDGAKFTPAEFDLYRWGWDQALLIVMRALENTVQRYELIERTKRLEAKRRRAGKG